MQCSCDAGVAQNLAGMLATTWSGGALAIVQKLNVMPSSLHPCNKLLAGAPSPLSLLAFSVCSFESKHLEPFPTSLNSAIAALYSC